jgi:MoaA/NifB/PqqE/SkfB family radical SAM enzyme
MKSFVWDVQYFCPLECVYCYSSSGPKRQQVDAAQLMRVAEAIAREKPDAVILSGGEPALAKGIEQAAALLRAHGISLSIFTSGWGLDAARAARLAPLFDRIHVSLDSSDPEINDSIRGKKGAHRNALAALEVLSRQKKDTARLRFGVECMVLQPNFPGVRDFCAFAAAIAGIDFINIAPAVPSGRASRPEFTLLLAEEQVVALLASAPEIRAMLPRSIALSIHRNDFLKVEDDRCIHIDASGGVRAIKICEMTVGNLVEEPLDQLLLRARSWRSDSPLASRLPQVRDFVAWADVVRRLEGEVES